MLEKFFIVDYTEGSGGEYFSNFISVHKGFYSSSPFIDNMQLVSGGLQKYFNSHNIRDPQWDKQFDQHVLDFLQMCENSNVKNICVPYHLYKNSSHIQRLLKFVPSARFIKINTNNNHLPKLDYVRKILLRQFNKNDLKELQWHIQNFTADQKKLVIQKLKIKNLRYLDLYLIKNNLVINSQSRRDQVLNFLSKQSLPPSCDIEISYENFFVDFKHTIKAYDKLCNELNIDPEYDNLDRLIQRNQSNLVQLNQFVNNFERELELL